MSVCLCRGGGNEWRIMHCGLRESAQNAEIACKTNKQQQKAEQRGRGRGRERGSHSPARPGIEPKVLLILVRMGGISL